MNPRRSAGPLSWLFALSLVALGACAAQEPRSAFRTLEQGTQSGISAEVRRVIASRAEWEKFWREHAQGRLPVPPPPAVDFRKEEVVAVVLGRKPTGGHGVRIEAVESRGGKRRVRLRVTTPAPDAITTQALTSPFHLIAVPRSPLPVVFETR